LRESLAGARFALAGAGKQLDQRQKLAVWIVAGILVCAFIVFFVLDSFRQKEALKRKHTETNCRNICALLRRTKPGEEALVARCIDALTDPADPSKLPMILDAKSGLKANRVVLSIKYDDPTSYEQKGRDMVEMLKRRFPGVEVYNPNMRTLKNCDEECCLTGYCCRFRTIAMAVTSGMMKKFVGRCITVISWKKGVYQRR